MAAKLGTADVSFRLGATTPAAVYLGSEQVWTAVTPRTLYFTGADDGDWSNLANWFDDAEGTVAASSLPTAADSVIATASIDSNSGSAPTVVDFEMDAPSAQLAISMTVTGAAVFNSASYINQAILTGNATFNGDSSGANSGEVIGDATFNVQSTNGGIVTGNATFNGSSNNWGTVTGTATFNGSACNATGFGTAGTFVPDPPPACPE